MALLATPFLNPTSSSLAFSKSNALVLIKTLQFWTPANAGGESSLWEFKEEKQCTGSSFYPPNVLSGYSQCKFYGTCWNSIQHPPWLLFCKAASSKELSTHLPAEMLMPHKKHRWLLTCSRFKAACKTAQIILQQDCYRPYLLFEVSSVFFIHKHQI